MSRFIKRWAARISSSAVTRPLKLPATVRFDEKEKSKIMIRKLNRKPLVLPHLTEVELSGSNTEVDLNLSIDVF